MKPDRELSADRTPAAGQKLTVVLVTDQFQCKRLIVAGRELADRTATQLEVINVASPDIPQNPDAVEFLFQVSKEYDATMMVHYSKEPGRLIAGLLTEQQPQTVVSGLPCEENSLLHRIWTRFSQVDFYTVDHNGTLAPVTLGNRIIA
ncbi:MAG: hypothetical protein RR185_06500 [Angelakisella sp.]